MEGEIAGAKEISLEDTSEADFAAAKGASQRRERSLRRSGKDWNTIQKTLKGNGKAEVGNGALVDLNLVDGVLSGATGVAGAANLIPGEIKSKYPAIFSSRIPNLTTQGFCKDQRWSSANR